jgi:hypothetical protein
MNLDDIIYIKQNQHMDGRAIIYIVLNKEFQVTKKENAPVVAFIIKTINEALIASKKISSIEEFAIIVELKNYKKSKIGAHLPVALAKTLKALFPNRLHKCYLRNSPLVFRCIFRLIYPLLDKDTRKKIFFIKGDKEIPCTEYSLDNL